MAFYEDDWAVIVVYDICLKPFIGHYWGWLCVNSFFSCQLFSTFHSLFGGKITPIELPPSRASNAGFPRSANRTVFYDTASSSTTASESDPAAAAALHGGGLHQRIRVTSSSRLSRSRSLDKGRHNAPPRSRSLDCGGERRSSPDEVRFPLRVK